MKLKRLAALLTAGIFVLSAVGCTGGETSKDDLNADSGTQTENNNDGNNNTSDNSDTIKIGGIGPLTGELAMYGTNAMNGAQLAINESDGALGKKIEFIILDDKGDITEATNAYNKHVNNNEVSAIIGAVTSQPSAAVAVAAAKDNTPMITPTGTAIDITTYGENVFRACYTDPFQGKVIAAFAASSLEKKTAAVIYNKDSDYSIGCAEAFKTTFEEKGGSIVGYESYSNSDKDFKSQLTNIASKNPDVLFIPDYYSVVALIAKQVKDVNLKAVLLGTDGWDSVHSVVEDPSLIEGAFFCNHYSPDDTDPEVQNFITKYKETYGSEPNAFAALGYDAAKLIINAIETAGTTDKEAVVEALKNTDISAVTGSIKFDEERNPIKSVSILQIQNGQYKMYEKLNPSDL